jgi:hypothetical protein
MTLQEAMVDPNRPLSMTPREWMQYEEAKEQEEVENIDQTAKEIYVEEEGVSEEQADSEFGSEEKLEVGIEQMVLGCRIAIRALNELSRKDVSVRDRKAYDGISEIVNRAIAPYLADMMKYRKEINS